MPSDALTTLGREKFVSLTTFRRSGDAVSTAVWIAQDGDALVVTAGDQTGKVKRLRNDPRVMALEHVMRSGPATRVILRITP